MSLPAKETYKIFIGGLTIETTEAQLEECFAKFGFVYDILIIRHRDSGLSKGYGFITCNSIKTYQRITSSEHNINGRAIDCHSSFKKSDDPEKFKENANKKIFVGGISMETTDDDLYNYFCQFGTIRQAYVIKDPVTRRSKKFGFAIMRDQAAVDAVLGKEGHVIKGITVSCKLFVRYTEEESQKKQLLANSDKINPADQYNAAEGFSGYDDAQYLYKSKKASLADSKVGRKAEALEKSALEFSSELNSEQKRPSQRSFKAIKNRSKNLDHAPVRDENPLAGQQDYFYAGTEVDQNDDGCDHIDGMDQAYEEDFEGNFQNPNYKPLSWNVNVATFPSRVASNDVGVNDILSQPDCELYNKGVPVKSLRRLLSQQIVVNYPSFKVTRYGTIILAGCDSSSRTISRPSSSAIQTIESQLQRRSQSADKTCYRFRVGPGVSVLRRRQ